MASKAKMVSLIPVKKMDRAIKFYTGTLGAKVLMRGEGEMGDGWASVKLGGVEVWFVNPGSHEKRKLSYHAFVVGNIKTFVAGLKRKKVKFDKPERMSKDTKIEGPIAWDMWGASAFFKDTEGNLLMAWQNLGPM